MKRFDWLLVVILLGVAAGCGYRKPPLPVGTRIGFRLPEGDVARGEATFRELRCYRCHEVEGVKLPSATELPKPVRLGGEVHAVRTDGYLVTSIIQPSHMVAPEDPNGAVSTDGTSSMPSYTDQMSVRQLVDLVAFLQSCYKVIARPPDSYP